MIESWFNGIKLLAWSFFFWIAGGVVLDTMYKYAYNSNFIMSVTEMNLINGLYSFWIYVLLPVIGVVFLYVIVYTNFKR